MSPTSQPGRIETPQTLSRPSSGATGATEKPQETVSPPKNSYFRNTRTARSLRATIPESKKKITTFGQAVFISFACVVDGTEAILDILAIGIIVNRVIDIIVAIIFFGYAFAKGLKFGEDWKVYASIFGTIAGEFMPLLDVAPFFTLDAWYITHAIKAKDKARQKATDEATKAAGAEQGRQEWIENYQVQQQAAEQEESLAA